MGPTDGRVAISLNAPYGKKTGKGRPYSITEHRVPELIPVLGSQPAGDMSHKPGGRRAATNFAAW